ncbi:MAG: DUF72 domain-containing protein [Thermomonas sp.]
MRIGCAGWAIPSQYGRLFQEDGSTLERYASRLDVVEINSSFYRPHQPKTYARWAASVPATFRFSVKVPKSITHDHLLVGTAPLVDQFLDECLELGHRLGGLLVQLQPSLQFDGRRANAFFGLLRRRLPDKIAIACEPRHPTWFGPKSLAICERYQVNRVAADPAPFHAPGPPLLPSDSGRWRYWRLHGSPRMYYSAYSPATLGKLVPALRQAARTSNVWVIFDNMAHGHAVENAFTLKSLVAAASHPASQMSGTT